MSGGVLELYGEILDFSQNNSIFKDTNNPAPNKNNVVLDEERSANLESNKTGPVSKESWFNNSLFAYSPTGDVFVVARGSTAAFYSSEWSSQKNMMIFSKLFEGRLTELEGEVITSVVVIPLISSKKSSPGAPDWTSVLIASSKGYLYAFTERGNLLFSQQFHQGRILAIKVHPYAPYSTKLQHEQLEEILLLYKGIVVSLDGFGLFQALRGCRNQLARSQATGSESRLTPPPLSSKSWSFTSESSSTTLSDSDLIGISTPSSFDHLFTASLLGGFYADSSSAPPTSNIFIAAGSHPFLSFHYGAESRGGVNMAEIAYAVASKVKSSLLGAASGWLGFGGGGSEESGGGVEKKGFETPTPLKSRFGLPDALRTGHSLTISPCRKLTAVSDSLGRILLIDNNLGIGIRFWKGYRNAQTAWLRVEEESKRKNSSRNEVRTALFLVIYSPRRGQVEVYPMEQGPKVASLPVNKTGKLLSTNYGMMGLNSGRTQGMTKSYIECLFLDISGKLFTVKIPFHLGLCDKATRKLKDIHILKALQKLLRDGNYSEENILELLFELRTQSLINQAFSLISLKCSQTQIFTQVLNAYLQKFCDEEEKDLSIVFRFISLIDLFKSLTLNQAAPPPYDSTLMENDGDNEKSLLLCLHGSEKEILTLSSMAQHETKTKNSKGVKFASDTQSWTLPEFFTNFKIDSLSPNKSKLEKEKRDEKLSQGQSLRISLSFSSKYIDKFANLLLCGVYNGVMEIPDWFNEIKNSDLDPSELLLLTFKHWICNALASSSYPCLMVKLYHVVKALCELKGYENVVNKFNKVSKWWEDIREELSKSHQMFHIYSFSIVCRAVSIDIQTIHYSLEKNPKKRGRDGDESEIIPEQLEMETDDFENVSLDLMKWNILIKQIEDLYLLSSVISQKPTLKLPLLPTFNTPHQPLTVLQLLDKGKGCVAELVGRWLMSIGIDPQLISDEEQKINEDHEMMNETEKGEEADEAHNINQIIQLLNTLKENFSVSLSSCTIISNYCWEYCLEWNKDPMRVELLEGAIKCANAIRSPLISQGILTLIWNTFLNKRARSVITERSSEFVPDSGPPSPNNCILSGEARAEFLRLSLCLLDSLLLIPLPSNNEALMIESEVNSRPTAPVTGTLSNPKPSSSTRPNESNSRPSAPNELMGTLTQIALSQPNPNYEMILLHYQLVLTAYIHMVLKLRKNSLRPTNMFDTKSQMMFFQNIHTPAPFSTVEVDLSLKMRREEFLCLAMSRAIRGIHEDLSNPHSNNTTMVPSKETVDEAEKWLLRCFDLGRNWGIDLDGLRISQICEFYSNGWDSLGLEMIGAVSNRALLGVKLLSIAGMRVSFFINQKSESKTQVLSSLSTNLSKWLESLNYSTLQSTRFSKESISHLAQELVQLIPDSSYDFKLAEELLLTSSYI